MLRMHQIPPRNKVRRQAHILEAIQPTIRDEYRVAVASSWWLSSLGIKNGVH